MPPGPGRSTCIIRGNLSVCRLRQWRALAGRGIRSTCSRWVPTAASTRRSGNLPEAGRGRWFRLADSRFGDQFTIPPRSPISVLSRFAEHLDLFVVGRDAAVYSTFWDGSSGWSNDWFRLADTNFADGFKVPAGSQVTSLARASRFDRPVRRGVRWRRLQHHFGARQGGWLNRWFRLGDESLLGQFHRPAGHADRGHLTFP